MKINNSFCLLVLLGLTLFTNGCKRIINLHVNISNLYGEYESKYEIAEEKIILKPDGSFLQEVKLNSGSKSENTNGKWTYDKETGHITLDEHFMVVLDGFGKFNPEFSKPKTGLVILPVESIFGRIRIGSDEGVLYKKKTST